MIFQSVQTALVTALGNDAAGRYRTVGYKDEPAGQTEIEGNSKLVSVYYSRGSLPENLSGRFGPAIHKCSFDIDLKLSQEAKVDLATLENPNSTNGQRATALAGVQDAKNLANIAIDDFISIIFGVLTDNRNSYLGLDKKIFADRWIADIKKDEPMYFGDTVICSAVLAYTCDVEEEFVGDEGSAGTILDMTLNVNDEPTDGQAGVKEE